MWDINGRDGQLILTKSLHTEPVMAWIMGAGSRGHPVEYPHTSPTGSCQLTHILPSHTFLFSFQKSFFLLLFIPFIYSTTFFLFYFICFIIFPFLLPEMSLSLQWPFYSPSRSLRTTNLSLFLSLIYT